FLNHPLLTRNARDQIYVGEDKTLPLRRYASVKIRRCQYPFIIGFVRRICSTKSVINKWHDTVTSLWVNNGKKIFAFISFQVDQLLRLEIIIFPMPDVDLGMFKMD